MNSRIGRWMRRLFCTHHWTIYMPNVAELPSVQPIFPNVYWWCNKCGKRVQRPPWDAPISWEKP